jgi:hypothetical protein
MRTPIRAAVKHPMLIGLLVWSGVHLAATGDVAGTILFGSFFLYSIVALGSAIRRRQVRAQTRRTAVARRPFWRRNRPSFGLDLRQTRRPGIRYSRGHVEWQHRRRELMTRRQCHDQRRAVTDA